MLWTAADKQLGKAEVHQKVMGVTKQKSKRFNPEEKTWECTNNILNKQEWVTGKFP